MILVLSTYAVGRSAPFHRAIDPAVKFLPWMVRLNEPPRAAVLVGAMLEIVGSVPGATAISSAFDSPPPGDGLNTEIIAFPGDAISRGRTTAVSCESFTKLVTRSEPFQRTMELATKFDPITVRVTGAPPDMIGLGRRLETAGTGLVLNQMVRMHASDVPPPGAGLKTVTKALPGAARSDGGMSAESSKKLIHHITK